MGNVFGGVILEEIDRVAYVTATRHSGLSCVTASFDRVDFIAPVRLGQVVTFESRLTFVGRSSMEIWVGVHAEDLSGPPRRRVGDAFVTMVAVDADGHPTEVRPLMLTTEEDRRLHDEGAARMAARQALRRANAAPTARGHAP